MFCSLGSREGPRAHRLKAPRSAIYTDRLGRLAYGFNNPAYDWNNPAVNPPLSDLAGMGAAVDAVALVSDYALSGATSYDLFMDDFGGDEKFEVYDFWFYNIDIAGSVNDMNVRLFDDTESVISSSYDWDANFTRWDGIAGWNGRGNTAGGSDVICNVTYHDVWDPSPTYSLGDVQVRVVNPFSTAIKTFVYVRTVFWGNTDDLNLIYSNGRPGTLEVNPGIRFFNGGADNWQAELSIHAWNIRGNELR